MTRHSFHRFIYRLVLTWRNPRQAGALSHTWGRNSHNERVGTYIRCARKFFFFLFVYWLLQQYCDPDTLCKIVQSLPRTQADVSYHWLILLTLNSIQPIFLALRKLSSFLSA